MHTCFLSSEDSKAIHPQNSAYSFIVELPDTLELNPCYWCALTEISYQDSSNNQKLYVETYIISYNYVKGTYLPVLRVITNPGIFNKPYYSRVKQERVSRIQINIITSDGQLARSLTGETSCVLQLKRKKYKT